MPLALLVAFAVSVNLWWIGAHRRGLPLDIDEAGYLQRAVADGDALDRGVSTFVRALRLPDPQAPLLPATAGVLRHLTGAGPYRLLGVAQLFYALALAATYLLARRLAGRRWALLATALVAASPGLLTASRQFGFAVPLTALLTATLATQLYSEEFRSLRLSLLWGALLGLTSLTRTQSLGLLPALLLAALVRLAVGRPGRVQVRNVLLGLGVALACSAWWYSATWRPVLDYLTDYGYGRHSADYGPAQTVWSLQWWTARPRSMLDSVLFAPITLALLVCLVVYVGWVLVPRVLVPRAGGRGRRDGARQRWARLRAWLRTDTASVAVVVAGCYLALSSTRNVGSYFVLPLLPAVVSLVAAGASRRSGLPRRVAAGACAVAAFVSFAGQNGLRIAPDDATVWLATAAVPVYAVHGPPLAYATAYRGDCPAVTLCTRIVPGESAEAQLRRWVAPSTAMAHVLARVATGSGRRPTVFFAVQDPLFNTNTVGLAYQLTYGRRLAVGLLRDPAAAGLSLRDQLDTPSLGRPNLVIVGPASTVAAAQVFSPTTDDAATRAALRADGFRPVDQVGLPDGRTMQVWWHAGRGPRHRGTPLG